MISRKIRKDAIEFAKESGLFLLGEFKKRRRPIKREHTKELKTVYDRSSERLIKKSIQRNYPTHSILAEETGYLEKDPDFLWIVDPLDGTANFVNGDPLFSVSIALMINQRLELGAIHFPVLDEIFVAERNKGAFLNERKIKVSNVRDVRKSYLVTCEGGEKSKERKAKLYKILVSRAIDLRKIGSGSLECAWVASSRADAYVAFKVPPWDVAAGILLVKEAGGKISDFKGRRWKLRKTDLIVSNGKLHEGLIKLVGKI